MDSSSQAGSSNDHAVVETDPKGRYVRYNKIIGDGAWRKVYLGFDKVDGIEIAWTITVLTEETQKRLMNTQMLCAEGDLLKSLKHENIIRCYDSWIIDDEQNKVKTIHMITELFTSGNLLDYVNKHNIASIRAIKIFAIQILKGLHYLHSQTPRIVHGAIKCENILVNGNAGRVKLGDFRFALRVLEQYSSATPGFMTIDATQGPYNSQVDINSFGMCILQMVTRERPYIFYAGKPVALKRVTDPEVLKFIERCLADDLGRPSAVGLLNDPFLASIVSGELTARPRESVRDKVARLFHRIGLLCQTHEEQEQEQEQEQHEESHNEGQ